MLSSNKCEKMKTGCALNTVTEGGRNVPDAKHVSREPMAAYTLLANVRYNSAFIVHR